MRVAIDKTLVKKIKDWDEFEYVYIFGEDEKLKDLCKLGIECVSPKYKTEIDVNLTEYDIPCLKKAKFKDVDWRDKPLLKENKIAIIIPNYNYARWLDTCLTSIEEQEYRNFEIIFVDDCSTDNSVKIAKRYQEKYGNIKVIELKQKRLNGGARNEAYLHISDDVDYIYYVDSDDWLHDNQALKKINRALFSNPDVLFVGMASYKNGKTMQCYSPQYKDRYEAIKGWSGSCGKVIKKELATRKECLYNEGTLKEDRNQHRRICIYMETFENLDYPVYVWNQTNTQSVTTIRDEALWGTSTIRHYADTLQLYLTEKGKDERMDLILKQAVDKTKKEMETKGGDQQW